jgi:hypothetical protein
MNDSIIKELYDKKGRCKELAKTIKLIQSLPPNVSIQIYDEYIIGKKLCREFISLLLQVHQCEKTQLQELSKMAGQVLDHPCVVEYLRKNLPPFKYAYDFHYKENKKEYLNVSKLDSFTMTLLYHNSLADLE